MSRGCRAKRVTLMSQIKFIKSCSSIFALIILLNIACLNGKESARKHHKASQNAGAKEDAVPADILSRERIDQIAKEVEAASKKRERLNKLPESVRFANPKETTAQGAVKLSPLEIKPFESK
jgi:hypothetical protein